MKCFNLLPFSLHPKLHHTFLTRQTTNPKLHVSVSHYAGILKHGLSLGKAYLTDMTEVSERQGVMGFFNACSSLGFIFGPLISGYLADLDESLQLCMLCGTLSFSLNIIFILLLVKSLPPPAQNPDNSETIKEMLNVKNFLSSVNIFRGVHWWRMADLIFLRFLTTFAVLMFRSNLTIFLQENFSVDYKTLGKIMSFNGVTGTIAAATCGRVSRLYTNPGKQMLHFLCLLAFSLLGATCAPNLPFLVAMIVPLSFATGNLRICMLNMFLSRVSEEEKGEVIGLGYSITSMSRMLSPSFVGVAQEWSPQLSGYVSSTLACSAAVAVATCSLGIKPQQRSKSELSRNGPESSPVKDKSE